MFEAAIRWSNKVEIVFLRSELSFGLRELRSYALSAIRIGPWDLSYLFQVYRPGASIPQHADGPKWTKTLAIVLWQPDMGRLFVEGPHRIFLRGRVILFNGADPHRVSTCSSWRVSLLLQFARL